jgi:hypothetical protein
VNRVRLFRAAWGLALGVLLVGCELQPIEATLAAAETATGAEPPGPVEPAPAVETRHRMSTDVAGPVDLGPEPTVMEYGKTISSRN